MVSSDIAQKISMRGRGDPLVTNTAQPSMEELDELYGDDKAFAPQEYFTLAELVDLSLIFLSDERLKAMQVDTESAAFKASFGDGVPALEIAIKGIDVDFAFAEDHIKRIQIPMANTSGRNFGMQKGPRSQLDITKKAFVAVCDVGPFGQANREKLIGLKIRWGQHIGSMDDPDGGSEEIVWRWDIPRLVLPGDFTYEGPVRVIQGRDGATAGGQVATAELTEDEAIAPMLVILNGQLVEASPMLCNQILDNVQGLPTKWVQAAIDGSLLRQLGEAGHIGQSAGKITVPTAG